MRRSRLEIKRYKASLSVSRYRCHRKGYEVDHLRTSLKSSIKSHKRRRYVGGDSGVGGMKF